MDFKQFKTKQLKNTKVWLWYKWLFIEVWWAKKFSKLHTSEELVEELNK